MIVFMINRRFRVPVLSIMTTGGRHSAHSHGRWQGGFEIRETNTKWPWSTGPVPAPGAGLLFVVGEFHVDEFAVAWNSDHRPG